MSHCSGRFRRRSHSKRGAVSAIALIISAPERGRFGAARVQITNLHRQTKPASTILLCFRPPQPQWHTRRLNAIAANLSRRHKERLFLLWSTSCSGFARTRANEPPACAHCANQIANWFAARGCRSLERHMAADSAHQRVPGAFICDLRSAICEPAAIEMWRARYVAHSLNWFACELPDAAAGELVRVGSSCASFVRRRP